jgi:hypothetical protein
MGAQENVALPRSLLDLYNSRQSDPTWLEKSMAAFAADAERFPDNKAELTNVFATEDQVTLECTLRWNVTDPPVSARGSSSKHEALGRTAVLFCLPDQEREDRQSALLLRYADPDGTTRPGSCMGTGDGVTAPARFSCSMRNPVGNSCQHKAPGRTGALLEQTGGGGTPFRSEKIIA